MCQKEFNEFVSKELTRINSNTVSSTVNSFKYMYNDTLCDMYLRAFDDRNIYICTDFFKNAQSLVKTVKTSKDLELGIFTSPNKFIHAKPCSRYTQDEMLHILKNIVVNIKKIAIRILQYRIARGNRWLKVSSNLYMTS